MNEGMNEHLTALLCPTPLGLRTLLSLAPCVGFQCFLSVHFQKVKTHEASAPYSQRSGGWERDGKWGVPLGKWKVH